MELTIPVLSRIPNLLKELRRVLPQLKFHEVVNSGDDACFRTAEVLICDFDLLIPHLYALPNAKWVQGTWAGFEALTPHIQQPRLPSYQISRFTGPFFGKLMSEYIIANIINLERNMFQIRENQRGSIWGTEGVIHSYRSISDLCIGVMGLGHIGHKVAEILHLFGATVLGVARTSTEHSCVKQLYSPHELPVFLKQCDYIVSILPRTSETDGILDNNVLENCKGRNSVLINVGRSNIISEKSLVGALEQNWISAAVLDVFDQEPLPQSSPLWKLGQVFITPHVAAVSRARDIADYFASNLKLYQSDEPVPALIDFTRGY